MSPLRKQELFVRVAVGTVDQNDRIAVQGYPVTRAVVDLQEVTFVDARLIIVHFVDHQRRCKRFATVTHRLGTAHALARKAAGEIDAIHEIRADALPFFSTLVHIHTHLAVTGVSNDTDTFVALIQVVAGRVLVANGLAIALVDAFASIIATVVVRIHRLLTVGTVHWFTGIRPRYATTGLKGGFAVLRLAIRTRRARREALRQAVRDRTLAIAHVARGTRRTQARLVGHALGAAFGGIRATKTTQHARVCGVLQASAVLVHDRLVVSV